MTSSKMHATVTVLVLCSIIVHGLTITRKVDDWPLENCRGTNIDLILVADGATMDQDAPPGEPYRKQIRFFSQLLDIFMSPGETSLKRLRVSVIASTVNMATSRSFPDVRIPFDLYENKAELQAAIENDTIVESPKSNPLTVMMNIMTELMKNPAFGIRKNATHVIIMIVDGGKPFQITKVESDTLDIFSTTNIKVLFILMGSEAALNMQNVFPSNNFVKMESAENLLAKQSIPIQLCKTCYPGWFRFWRSEPEIGVIRISCYKLFYHHEDLNWMDANGHCHAVSASLVSTETVEEMDFLKDTIPKMMELHHKELGERERFVNIYIGLLRRKSSLGQRFVWLNNMPLIHTNWGTEQPINGVIHGCVVWNFTIVDTHVEKRFSPANFTNTSLVLEETLDTMDNNESYWSSVGCGHLNGHVFLCESENKLFTRRQVGKLKTAQFQSPSDSSIQKAIKRGQLAYFKENETLVAISALQISDSNLIQGYSAFTDHDLMQTSSLNALKLYPCGDISATRIPYAMVCDHDTDCLNALDETVCRYRECDNRSEFACRSGQCVPIETRCDLVADCLDSSDEENCMICRHKRCPDGRCLPTHWFVDGEVDCSSCTNDGSIDREIETAEVSDTSQCLFICNHTQCVSSSLLTNGRVDCHGPEGNLDETIGALESTACYEDSDLPPAYYSNWGPRCIYIKDRYGETLGCRDMKHLQGCEDFICPVGYFKCPSSYCIPSHYVQNAAYDCPLGEDELDVYLDCPGYFMCAATSMCLHPDLVCDRHVHCPERDDELNCHVTCQEGFVCMGGAIIVDDSYDKRIPLKSFIFMDPRTRYLDVSGVNISAVFPNFPKGHFHNLLNASLSDCSITFLNAAPATQNDLRALMWMDLSYNLIKDVSVTNIFRYMVGLRYLNLSHNTRLNNLHPDAFNTYSATSVLEDLDLSHTGITVLRAALFTPLVKLERLKLQNTALTDILPDMFPEKFQLAILDLRENVIENLYEDMFKNVIIRNRMYTSTFKLCCPQLHNALTPENACQSPSDPFSSCSDLINSTILRLLLWINGFLAIAGNTIVIIYRLFIDRKILKMAYGQFVTHLSFSDFFMGVYLIIIAIADSVYRNTYVWDEMKWRNSVACKTAGFLSTLSSETSTMFIALITLDRFLVIRYPFGQMRITGHVITICCVMNWTLGTLLALIPLLPPFQHWTIYSSNGMCLGLPLTNRRQAGWQFSTAVFVFLNFFLFLLIAAGQIAIYRTMSEMRMNLSNLTNASSRRAQDLAVAKHLSLIAITDFMCWFPVGIMGLLSLGGTEIGMDAYAWTAVLVLPINSALNPLLYTIPTVTQRWRRFKEETACHVTKTVD